MSDLYYNPAGGNWSASNWGPSGGPYNQAPPGASDNAFLNGATVIGDVSTITCLKITNVVSGGYLSLDCSVATGRAYTLTCNLVGGTATLVITNAVTGTNQIYGLKVTGNITGGTATNAYGLRIGATASGSYYGPNLTVVGNVTGGSGTGARGILLYNINYTNITGTVTGGSAAGGSAYGISGSYTPSYVFVTGDVVGGSAGTNNCGFDGVSYGNSLSITGNLLGGSGSSDNTNYGAAAWSALTLTGGNVTGTNNGSAGSTNVAGAANVTTITGNVTAAGVTVVGQPALASSGSTTITGNVTGGAADFAIGVYAATFLVINGDLSGGTISGATAGMDAVGALNFYTLIITGNIINTHGGPAYSYNSTTRPMLYGTVIWNPSSLTTNYIQIRNSANSTGYAQYTVLGTAAYPTADQVQMGVSYQNGVLTGTYTGAFTSDEMKQMRYALGLTGTTAATSGTGLLDVISARQPAYQMNVDGSGAVKSQDVTLSSDGLDGVSITSPTGVASNFRQMLVQVWRAFFKKAVKSQTDIKTYADDGVTVMTTQSMSSAGGTDTQGAAT